MSMPERHTMTRTTGNGVESLFDCPVSGCNRRLVLNHIGGGIVVIEEGNGALHQGSSGPVGFYGAVDVQE
jgi:hypothetical protein